MVLLQVDTAAFEGHVARIVESLHWFAPEFQVAITAIAILLFDLFIPKRASKHLAWLAIFGLIYATVSALSVHDGERRVFLGMLASDSYSSFFKLFFLVGGVPMVLLSYVSKELEGKRMGEYYAILLSSILGCMLMASSSHLLMAFMALELLSICSYILVGFHKRSNVGSEASLKYIIYGSVAAAFMGYGLSLLYGLSGTAQIPDILKNIATVQAEGLAGANFTVILALLLTFLGLAYKMATIPMHFWSPDVYEGAPTPITAFLSVASKAAGFALCMRFFGSFTISGGVDGGLGDAAVGWPIFVMVVAMVTMTLGNLAALWQENLKRLFAYSSIAHAGYMLMGVALLELPGASAKAASGGISAVSFYLLAYLAMNLGAFAVIILIENRTGSVNLREYDGIGWRAPFLGISLVIFLFSLVGIPPTAGFMGKLQLFMGVVVAARDSAVTNPLQLLLYIMAVVALANTAISVYYYARIIRNMYLTKLEEGVERLKVPILGTAVVAAMLIMTFYLFFDANDILEHTRNLKLFVGVE